LSTEKRSLPGRPTGRKSSLTCYLSFTADANSYAAKLKQHLTSLGIAVIRPEENLIAGEQFVNVMDRSLNRVDFVILIGTSEALHSRWIEAEIGYVVRDNIPILPIMSGNASLLEDVSYSHLPYFLRQIMWAREESFALGPSQRVLEQLETAISKLKSRYSRSTAPLRVQAEKRPLNEGKLILVGRGEVGKTSLVRRLVENEFTGQESKTQGIRITQWSLASGTNRFRLNIWDFGGQEMMHATHQFFLTEQSLYLLVLNGREGGEDVDAEYWLKHIESFGGESPIIIVQNKIAQHPFELNYRGLQARYPQIRHFIKTDCQEGTGVGELRALIEDVAGGMAEIKMPFPADWWRVKERLEAMPDEHLDHRAFVELCAKEGIEDESDQDRLGFVLHCLGIALTFRDDSRLRETSVLKPEWVTQGIYAILNANRLAERQGELSLSDLRDLLPRKRYPLDKHLFLMELMRKFSLCFPFHDEAERYLIPELLGKEEPSEVSSFEPGQCLNFEYCYGVLPEGLLPRFIVRTHTLSRGQHRWRSGVILAYEECKALVKTEPLDRRVIVRVKGGDAGSRRRLLAIIRYDLDRIHAEFKDRLEVQAKVPLKDAPQFSVDYKKLIAFERRGMKEFPEFIGQDVVTVRVTELLNGVDFQEQRDDSIERLGRAKALFFSYSHKDEGLRDELETHLKLLQRQRIISVWHDRKIAAGSEWDGEIDSQIAHASVILLLVSADFIASTYCWDKEVKLALERHAEGKAVVIPILLRSCDWKGAPFGKLQGLPKDMKPVTAWSDRDAAWTDVAAGIRSIAEKMPSSSFGDS
jgi:internalin A